MEEQEIRKILAKVECGFRISFEESRVLLKYISSIESILDEADDDDVFGTEGWRHRIGME